MGRLSVNILSLLVGTLLTAGCVYGSRRLQIDSGVASRLADHISASWRKGNERGERTVDSTLASGQSDSAPVQLQSDGLDVTQTAATVGGQADAGLATLDHGQTSQKLHLTHNELRPDAGSTGTNTGIYTSTDVGTMDHTEVDALGHRDVDAIDQPDIKNVEHQWPVLMLEEHQDGPLALEAVDTGSKFAQLSVTVQAEEEATKGPNNEALAPARFTDDAVQFTQDAADQKGTIDPLKVQRGPGEKNHAPANPSGSSNKGRENGELKYQGEGKKLTESRYFWHASRNNLLGYRRFSPTPSSGQTEKSIVDPFHPLTPSTQMSGGRYGVEGVESEVPRLDGAPYGVESVNPKLRNRLSGDRYTVEYLNPKLSHLNKGRYSTERVKLQVPSQFKADHPGSVSSAQGHSPGGASIFSPAHAVNSFSDNLIDGNSKYVIGMRVNRESEDFQQAQILGRTDLKKDSEDLQKVRDLGLNLGYPGTKPKPGFVPAERSRDAVPTPTSDVHLAYEQSGPIPADFDNNGAYIDKWGQSGESPHHRARRNSGNYTVGAVSSNDNDTWSDNSTLDVTVDENSTSTAASTQQTQASGGTTTTQTVDVDGGSGDENVVYSTHTDRSLTTSKTLDVISSSTPKSVPPSDSSVVDSTSSASKPSSPTQTDSSSSVSKTTPPKDPTEQSPTNPTPAETTTPANSTTPVVIPSSEFSIASSSPSSSLPQTSPGQTSSTTVSSAKVPSSSGPTVTAKQNSTLQGSTSVSQKTSENVPETSVGSSTGTSVQTPDLAVGRSVAGEDSSNVPAVQESSSDTASVTQDTVQQVSTVELTASAEPFESTKSDEGLTISTHRVVRSSEPTPSPVTTTSPPPPPPPTTTTSSPAPSPTSTAGTAVDVGDGGGGPGPTTDDSNIFSDPTTLTPDSSTGGEEDEEAGIPEGGSYPEPTGRGGGAGGADHSQQTEDEGATGEGSAEPGPDWSEAKMLWGEAWELHLYVFGFLFGLLGVYTLVSVLRLWSIHRLLSRRYFVSLNLLMLLLCSTRAVYLLLDGYNSNQTFHQSLDYFLYSISFPCLSSAFSIQLYALLQATKMQFLPPTIQKMSMLIVVTVFHFAISIATDVVVGMYAGMQIMLFVCQLFFILWGLFLFFGYAYIFRRLYLHAVKRQKHVTQKSGSYSMSGSTSKPKSKFTLSVAVKVTFSTAILGLVTVGLEIYGMVGVYKNFSSTRPQPWPWYIYHTTLRLIEFLMCATMSYVASQPFRYRKRRQCCCCPVLCAPCAEICCCGADVNRSNSLAGWSDIDQHQMRASFDRGNAQNVSLQHEGISNGHMNGGGDLTVAAKTRIYFKDRADVMPIMTSQPTSLSDSRPTSATSDFVDENTMSTRGSRASVTGSIDGSAAYYNPYRNVPSPNSENKRFFTPNQRPVSSTPIKTRDGVVNTAYSTTDDPQSMAFASSKSRNGSIASSDFFHAPSVSLADSMASELDKAFRSMHEDQSQEPSTRAASNIQNNRAHAVSTPSLPSLDEKVEPNTRTGTGTGRAEMPRKPNSTFPESSIQRFLQQQQNGDIPQGLVLRRSRSAIGRCSFQEVEPLHGGDEVKGKYSSSGDESASPWHMKLFRSRSDNSGGIRTKDVDNARYMLLPDVERSDHATDHVTGRVTDDSGHVTDDVTHRVPVVRASSASPGYTPKSSGKNSVLCEHNTEFFPTDFDSGSGYPSPSASQSPFSTDYSRSDGKTAIHSVSPGFGHSSMNASRLRYRDDESDDIEV